MDDDIDEPLSAEEVLAMVKNNMAVQIGDVYVDQRQQSAVFDQRQQQSVLIDKVQVGGRDPEAQASYEVMATQRVDRAAATATATVRPRRSTQS